MLTAERFCRKDAMVKVDFKMELGSQLMIGFQGLSAGEQLIHLIREFAIGGIVLFRRNIENPEQLRTLLEEAQAASREILKRPLWVAIDQEGGTVQRLVPPFTQLPSAQELAAQGAEAVAAWTRTGARELRKLGVHINFAPVVDVVPEGNAHFLGSRSLGSDPEEVARLARSWIRALQENGVSATAKHYPGLGRAQFDPHHHAPMIQWPDDASRERDLIPFRAAIEEEVHCMMTSHSLYPDLDPKWPATLSPVINQRWLRERLGFQGILCSDDLDMAAVCNRYTWEDVVRQGLLATVDFFLLCQEPEHIEPFARALWDGIRSHYPLADAHQGSLRRLEKLASRHFQ
jgi:beta-N-acetylhexosaminidase